MNTRFRSNTPLRITAVTAVAVVVGLFATSCGSPGDAEPREGKPVIATTTNILGDVVTQIVGDNADVLVLMPPEVDPHGFQLSTSEVASLYAADSLVTNGLGLEESITAQIVAAEAEGVPTLKVGEHVDPLAFDAHSEPEHHDDEHEDDTHDHGPYDPHFWHDPQRMMLAVEAITEHLRSVEGLDFQDVQQRADTYLAELTALDAELEEEFAVIPQSERLLVTQHQVFGYLAHRYDFKIIGSILPSGSTVAEASAADLTRVADAIKATGVPAIFTDATQAEKLAHTVVRESGLDVQVVPLYTESLTAPGGGADTYVDMMRANAQSIVSGLTSR